MTAPSAPRDLDSYSLRHCRCGHDMQHLLGARRPAWVCPSCGRRAKR